MASYSLFSISSTNFLYTFHETNRVRKLLANIFGIRGMIRSRFDSLHLYLFQEFSYFSQLNTLQIIYVITTKMLYLNLRSSLVIILTPFLSFEPRGSEWSSFINEPNFPVSQIQSLSTPLFLLIISYLLQNLDFFFPKHIFLVLNL